MRSLRNLLRPDLLKMLFLKFRSPVCGNESEPRPPRSRYATEGYAQDKCLRAMCSLRDLFSRNCCLALAVLLVNAIRDDETVP